MLSQATKGRTRTETWTPFPGQQPCSLSLCSPPVCLIPPSAQSYVQRTEFRKQAYRKSIPNQMPYVCVDFDLQIKCPLSILSWEGHSSLRQLGWQVCHTFLLCSDTVGFCYPASNEPSEPPFPPVKLQGINNHPEGCPVSLQGISEITKTQSSPKAHSSCNVYTCPLYFRTLNSNTSSSSSSNKNK